MTGPSAVAGANRCVVAFHEPAGGQQAGERGSVWICRRRSPYARRVDKVFISSVITGYTAERAAAKGAIESLDLRPVMAETAASSPDPSKVALLGHIDRCDVVVLLLAGWYGYVSENDLSPTEDEYRHAVSRGKPVLAFVHEGVEREEAQQAFVDRVRGKWERDGVYTSSFTTPHELTLLVVKALNEQRTRDAGGDAQPAAKERALALAAGERHRSHHSSGRTVRVAFVPVGTPGLLDAFALDDAKLSIRVIEAARRHELFSQAAAAEHQLNSAGVVVAGREERHGEGATVTFADDGAVLVELPVQSDGSMGSMAISHPRVTAGIEAAGLLAQDLWDLVEHGDRVGQVCAAIGVPDAGSCSYSMSGRTGGTMTMGSTPSPLVAPDPPVVLRRADVGAPATSDRLAIPLKRLFADHRSLVD